SVHGNIEPMSFAQTASSLFPPCNTNSRRRIGQDRPNRRSAPASAKAGLGGLAGYSIVCFALPLPVTKIQGEVAISGAPFFAYFLWQDKESEAAPAGDETQDAPPRQAKTTMVPKKHPK
ncbi:hypothetical protein, partial [Ralstonia solanacearum]|uniref:hypothetical protein n=1 Tax=Ralstonia solanacearum TaxID=305 RepID=UPI001FD77439